MDMGRKITLPVSTMSMQETKGIYTSNQLLRLLTL